MQVAKQFNLPVSTGVNNQRGLYVYEPILYESTEETQGGMRPLVGNGRLREKVGEGD